MRKLVQFSLGILIMTRFCEVNLVRASGALCAPSLNKVDLGPFETVIQELVDLQLDLFKSQFNGKGQRMAADSESKGFSQLVISASLKEKCGELRQQFPESLVQSLFIEVQKRVNQAGDQKGFQNAEARPSKGVEAVLVFSPRLMRHFNHEWGSVVATYSHDGKTVVTAGGNGLLRLWDTQTGNLLKTISGDVNSVFRGVAFSPDDQSIATVADNGYVQLWYINNPNKKYLILEQHGPRNPSLRGSFGISFSPDGEFIIASSTNNYLSLIRTRDGRSDRLLGDYRRKERITHASFSPDGQRIVGASADCWCVSGRLVDVLANPRSRVLVL